MADPVLRPDHVSLEIASTLADHLIRYAQCLLESGDREGAVEVFQEAAQIQIRALWHTLEDGVLLPRA